MTVPSGMRSNDSSAASVADQTAAVGGSETTVTTTVPSSIGVGDSPGVFSD